MKRFKKILVGVDLSDVDQFVADQPAGPSVAAMERALELAKANSAQLLFMYVLDPSTLQLPANQHEFPKVFPDRAALEDQARERLSKLAENARQQGIPADGLVTVGKSWIELIRQVLSNNHDLVIAGTRRFGPFRSMLFGSTGMKLLRNCPCPVWITQPQQAHLRSILVAHDLEPVGDLAMQLGSSMAQMHDAQLHVFHAIRYPEMDNFLPTRVASEDLAKYRSNAEQHITNQLEGFLLSKPAQVHLEYAATAYSHILNLIERHNIELLVMGTVARTGIAGFITGNTAERLLPHIPCSVIAVKPPGFTSPVGLE